MRYVVGNGAVERKTSSQFTGFRLQERPLRVAEGGVASQQRQQRAQSAERRTTTAFASAVRTQPVTQHNISPRQQHPHLTASRTSSTSSSKHPFHNCPPPSAHRRHQACSSTACFFYFVHRLGLFSPWHLHSPGCFL